MLWGPLGACYSLRPHRRSARSASAEGPPPLGGRQCDSGRPSHTREALHFGRPLMRALISNPVNDVQKEFNVLCTNGGGVRGGPVRGKTLQLLRTYGKKLNVGASTEVRIHLDTFSDANPWYVCFALGLCWGHLARVDLDFTSASIGSLFDLNDADLRVAGKFHLERGPEPIINSLKGAHTLFQLVQLPKAIPTTLVSLGRAQERWLSPILNP